MKILPPHLIESDPLSTAASGMAAMRVRMNVLANNMANMHTTRNNDGDFAPYLRKSVLFRTQKINPQTPDQQGVEVASITTGSSPLARRYEPHHPEADERGYRFVPNISVPRELVKTIEASRAYEANLNAFTVARKALAKTSSILDKST